MTPAKFIAALDEIAEDQFGPWSPLTWTDGECDVCGENVEVRLNDEGLTCRECNDDYRQPYDFADPYEVRDNGWGWDE